MDGYLRPDQFLDHLTVIITAFEFGVDFYLFSTSKQYCWGPVHYQQVYHSVLFPQIKEGFLWKVGASGDPPGPSRAQYYGPGTKQCTFANWQWRITHLLHKNWKRFNTSVFFLSSWLARHQSPAPPLNILTTSPILLVTSIHLKTDNRDGSKKVLRMRLFDHI